MDSSSKKREADRGGLGDQSLASSCLGLLARKRADDAEGILTPCSHWWRARTIDLWWIAGFLAWSPSLQTHGIDGGHSSSLMPLRLVTLLQGHSACGRPMGAVNWHGSGIVFYRAHQKLNTCQIVKADAWLLTIA